MARKNREIDNWFKPEPLPVCPLCDREIPDSQSDEHHLVPKVKGGKITQTLHRICHRQIHALYSESELAQKYSTVESLLEQPEVQKFVKWVKTKPLEFCDGTKLSNRRK